VPVQTVVLLVVQWLHVIFAIFWFGSALYSRAVIWPALRRLGPERESEVIGAMRSGPARRITIVVSSGTVILGIVRGVAAGVLGELTTLYGLTFLVAAAVGVTMALWTIVGFGPAWLARLFVPGFFLMFTLMILMRFGY
jgi:uncharacterized membrane protein